MWRSLLPAVALSLPVPLLAASASETPAPPGPGRPPGGPAVLSVRFDFRPEVGEHPPVLTVSVENTSDKPIPFMRFETARCFADFYLGLEIRGPGGAPVSLTPCVVKAFPGVDGTLAPGRPEQIRVPLAELTDLPTWPKGAYVARIAWDPAALERALGKPGPYAAQTLTRNSRFVITKPLAKLRVSRGQTVALPGGVHLTFRAHGHKKVRAGETSPLLVRGELQEGTTPPAPFDVHVELGGDRQFRIRGHAFELVSHAYDEWMELTYYGHLPEAE